jgi:hypothetical protein
MVFGCSTNPDTNPAVPNTQPRNSTHLSNNLRSLTMATSTFMRALQLRVAVERVVMRVLARPLGFASRETPPVRRHA